MRMEGRQPNREGHELNRRQKRTLAAVGVVLAAALGGLGVWSATAAGSYGPSREGCVNVVIPSTTGGAIVHACGSRAEAVCRRAFSHHDRLALLTRAQCKQAGLG